ncbi:hypothetical protein H9Q73_000380 [Fusarium xylarioides]|nr:hypothetical protein H9Q73_000380 [Fusarium xylarioides]
MLSENCRKAAAIDKTSETRMAASLVPSLVKKVATAHPLVVTQPEHLASKLMLTWSTFKMSGATDTSFIDMMLATMEDCRGDLRYRPQTRTDAEVTAQNFRAALLAVKSHLEASVAYTNRGVEAIAGQHGALLKHTSIDVLMRKLGNAADVAHATSLFKQAAALHAIQYFITARAAAESDGDMIPLIDQMLHSRPFKKRKTTDNAATVNHDDNNEMTIVVRPLDSDSDNEEADIMPTDPNAAAVQPLNTDNVGTGTSARSVPRDKTVLKGAALIAEIRLIIYDHMINLESRDLGLRLDHHGRFLCPVDATGLPPYLNNGLAKVSGLRQEYLVEVFRSVVFVFTSSESMKLFSQFVRSHFNLDLA